MSVLDTSHLQHLLKQSEAELADVQARIVTLEETLENLEALRHKVKQLKAFQQGIQQALSPALVKEAPSTKQKISRSYRTSSSLLSSGATGVFLPELAFKEADEVLRHRQSINYEIFRAVVLQGGQAHTTDIRDYLITENVKTPQGKDFKTATLSEISARVAYLVKRGVLRPIAPGRFQSCFGWDPLVSQSTP
jgi:hypothetical protein